MKVWFDTEFIDDGRTIELISIGMICESGEAYYAESISCQKSRANEWVKKNVIPHLLGHTHELSREEIASDIKRIVGQSPEFWAFNSAYDWVVLCQLYGPMVNLPVGWPSFCRDVKHLHVMAGKPELPRPTGRVHYALYDAMWAREAYLFLRDRIL